MKSKRNVLAAVLMASGALLAASASHMVAVADDTATTPPPPPQGGHWHHHGGPMRLLSQLGLTDEQKASIKTIFQAAKPQMQALHQQAQANHQKLTQSKPDDPNHASVVAEVAQSEATLASQRTSQMDSVRSQIYALLTPTQKTQLATLEAQHAARAAAREAGGTAPQ